MDVFNNIWRPKSLVMIFLTIEGARKVWKCAEYFENKKKKWDGIRSFESIQEIVKYFGNSKAFHLNVNGTGVLNRKLTSTPNFQEELIVSGDKSEFYFSYFNEKSQLAVSFFRSAIIDETIEEFDELKAHLIGVSSGPIALLTLSDFTLNSNFHFVVVRGSIESFKKGEETAVKAKINIDGKSFDYYEKLAESTLELFNKPRKSIVLGEGSLINTSIEYFEHKKFVFFGVSVTLLILTILLVNFFYHGHLNDKIAQQELDLSVSQSNLTHLDQMELEIMRKSELIRASGIMSNEFIAYYLDEIGHSVPKKMKLSIMDIYPLTKKLKAKHKVEVDKYEIQIQGSTENNEVLDNWIEELTEFDWVHSVKLISYWINDKNVPLFELKLKLKE